VDFVSRQCFIVSVLLRMSDVCPGVVIAVDTDVLVVGMKTARYISGTCHRHVCHIYTHCLRHTYLARKPCHHLRLLVTWTRTMSGRRLEEWVLLFCCQYWAGFFVSAFGHWLHENIQLYEHHHILKYVLLYCDEFLVSSASGPCGAWGRCRISPPRFLAECRKRRLNQGSFVSAVCLVFCFLWFVLCLCVYLCDLYWVFSLLLFVSNSRVIGCEDRLQNDLYCVGWGVKLYSIQSNPALLVISVYSFLDQELIRCCYSSCRFCCC